MKKLIACDLDGTLLTSKKEITEETRSKILDFIDQGNYFTIATGRIFQATKAIYHKLGFKSYSIACNGAMLVNNITDEIIYTNPLKADIAYKLIDLFTKHDIYFHYYSEDTIHANKYMNTVEAFDKMYSKFEDDMKIKIHVSDDLKEPIKNGTSAYKFGIYEDGSFDVDLIKKELSEIDGIDFYKSSEVLLDVMTKGVSKGSALIKLADILGVDQSETFAFGDNENDLSMIVDAKHGIAMDNAIDLLKENAQFITKTNDEDGIVFAMENYISKH
jgi:hypothetical protein